MTVEQDDIRKELRGQHDGELAEDEPAEQGGGVVAWASSRWAPRPRVARFAIGLLDARDHRDHRDHRQLERNEPGAERLDQRPRHHGLADEHHALPAVWGELATLRHAEGDLIKAPVVISRCTERSVEPSNPHVDCAAGAASERGHETLAPSRPGRASG